MTAASRGAPVTEDYAEADVTGFAISPNYQRDRIVFAATSVGLLRTTTGGDDWLELDRGIDTDEIRAVGVSSTYARDRTVFAGGPLGLGYKSTDNGNSWTQIDYEFDGETIAAIATGPDFANDQTLFVGTLGERTAAVHLSTDGGATFERFVDHDSAAPWIALGIPASYTPDNRWWMFATAGQVFKPAERFSDIWSGTHPASRRSAVLAVVPAAGARRRTGVRRHQRRGVPQRDGRRVVGADQCRPQQSGGAYGRRVTRFRNRPGGLRHGAGRRDLALGRRSAGDGSRRRRGRGSRGGVSGAPGRAGSVCPRFLAALGVSVLAGRAIRS